MIKIKKYYCHYNPKDDCYYVDKSYPQRKKKSEKNNISRTSKENSTNNFGLNSLLENAPTIISALPSVLGLLKQFKK
ncbi:hypothetical protein COL23_27460 [Priestia aryabhattai]|nr:hypothetical protein COL23_27460 [Priestia aryabhattai]